jgi:hypothetical protein
MQKLLKHRPSAGTLIAFIALCVALGGGAYAATKKITYKGLDKDARLKVQPVSATNAGSSCDPNSTTAYTICTSVSLKTSSAFPRRTALTFNGVFNSAQPTPTPAPADRVRARGECRLQLDGQPLNGTQIRVAPSIHIDPTPPVDSNDKDYGDGYGINIVTTPQGGSHTYSVACNELDGDLKVQQFQLSALTVR